MALHCWSQLSVSLSPDHVSVGHATGWDEAGASLLRTPVQGQVVEQHGPCLESLKEKVWMRP